MWCEIAIEMLFICHSLDVALTVVFFNPSVDNHNCILTVIEWIWWGFYQTPKRNRLLIGIFYYGSSWLRVEEIYFNPCFDKSNNSKTYIVVLPKYVIFFYVGFIYRPFHIVIRDYFVPSKLMKIFKSKESKSAYAISWSIQ